MTCVDDCAYSKNMFTSYDARTLLVLVVSVDQVHQWQKAVYGSLEPIACAAYRGSYKESYSIWAHLFVWRPVLSSGEDVTRWSDAINVQFTMRQRICLQPITSAACLRL